MKIDASITAPQATLNATELAAPLLKHEKLGKACDQFEGILVRQILTEGLKPLLAKPLGSGSTGGGLYDYMLTDTLANGVAGKNTMGISHLLQAQLSPRTASTTPVPPS